MCCFYKAGYAVFKVNISVMVINSVMYQLGQVQFLRFDYHNRETSGLLSVYW